MIDQYIAIEYELRGRFKKRYDNIQKWANEAINETNTNISDIVDNIRSNILIQGTTDMNDNYYLKSNKSIKALLVKNGDGYKVYFSPGKPEKAGRGDNFLIFENYVVENHPEISNIIFGGFENIKYPYLITYNFYKDNVIDIYSSLSLMQTTELKLIGEYKLSGVNSSFGYDIYNIVKSSGALIEGDRQYFSTNFNFYLTLEKSVVTNFINFINKLSLNIVGISAKENYDNKTITFKSFVNKVNNSGIVINNKINPYNDVYEKINFTEKSIISSNNLSLELAGDCVFNSTTGDEYCIYDSIINFNGDTSKIIFKKLAANYSDLYIKNITVSPDSDVVTFNDVDLYPVVGTDSITYNNKYSANLTSLVGINVFCNKFIINYFNLFIFPLNFSSIKDIEINNYVNDYKYTNDNKEVKYDTVTINNLYFTSNYLIKLANLNIKYLNYTGPITTNYLFDQATLTLYNSNVFNNGNIDYIHQSTINYIRDENAVVDGDNFDLIISSANAIDNNEYDTTYNGFNITLDNIIDSLSNKKFYDNIFNNIITLNILTGINNYALNTNTFNYKYNNYVSSLLYLNNENNISNINIDNCIFNSNNLTIKVNKPTNNCFKSCVFNSYSSGLQTIAFDNFTGIDFSVFYNCNFNDFFSTWSSILLLKLFDRCISGSSTLIVNDIENIGDIDFNNDYITFTKKLEVRAKNSENNEGIINMNSVAGLSNTVANNGFFYFIAPTVDIAFGAMNYGRSTTNLHVNSIFDADPLNMNGYLKSESNIDATTIRAHELIMAKGNIISNGGLNVSDGEIASDGNITSGGSINATNNIKSTTGLISATNNIKSNKNITAGTSITCGGELGGVDITSGYDISAGDIKAVNITSGKAILVNEDLTVTNEISAKHGSIKFSNDNIMHNMSAITITCQLLTGNTLTCNVDKLVCAEMLSLLDGSIAPNSSLTISNNKQSEFEITTGRIKFNDVTTGRIKFNDVTIKNIRNPSVATIVCTNLNISNDNPILDSNNYINIVFKATSVSLTNVIITDGLDVNDYLNLNLTSSILSNYSSKDTFETLIKSTHYTNAPSKYLININTPPYNRLTSIGLKMINSSTSITHFTMTSTFSESEQLGEFYNPPLLFNVNEDSEVNIKSQDIALYLGGQYVTVSNLLNDVIPKKIFNTNISNIYVYYNTGKTLPNELRNILQTIFGSDLLPQLIPIQIPASI